jgi:hypothetical protein
MAQMAQDGLLAEVFRFWNGFVRMMRDSYQPERHYMRGAGPKSLQLARVPIRKR